MNMRRLNLIFIGLIIPSISHCTEPYQMSQLARDIPSYAAHFFNTSYKYLGDTIASTNFQDFTRLEINPDKMCTRDITKITIAALCAGYILKKIWSWYFYKSPVLHIPKLCKLTAPLNELLHKSFFTCLEHQVDYDNLHNEIHISNYHYGDQHLRSHMEDAHTEALSDNFDFFAVFDGHCGIDAAQFTATHLHVILADLINQGISTQKALTQSFLITHHEFCKINQQSGTTVIAALINKKRQRLYLANIADARAIVCDPHGNIITQTIDHNLKNDTHDLPEKKRMTQFEIERINGVAGIHFVIEDGYIHRKGHNYKINVTRAIGDANFHPCIVALPNIIELTLPQEGLLILACDGLWDAGKHDSSNRQHQSERVAEYATSLLKKGLSEKEIAYNLVQKAKDWGVGDNISVTVINLNKYNTQSLV